MSDLDIEKQKVSVEFIEALLRRRNNGVDQRYHEDETADLAKVIAGVADDSIQKRAAEHLERCFECREVLLALRWADSVERDEDVPALSGKNALSRLATRSGRWGRISAAAVVVVALAFLISMIMPRSASGSFL
jgi:hypothetical protein